MSDRYFHGHAQSQPWLAACLAPFAGVLLSVVGLWIMAIPTTLHAVSLDALGRCLEPGQQDLAVHAVVIDADNAIYWDGQRLSNRGEAEARLRAIGVQDRASQSVVHIKPHRLADYGTVVAVMASAQRSGVVRMGVFGEAFAVMSDQSCTVCNSE